MADGLVIGTQDITAKDQALLKALVRLLNGGVNIQARFSEQLEECNVVFVPGQWPYCIHAPCIAVRVTDPAHPAVPGHGASDLVVAAPLRMTNVIAVLQAATQRVHGTPKGDPVQSLLSLFWLLAERTRTAERRRAVVPVSTGGQIVFDFVRQRLHTFMPMDVLLSGNYTLAAPHRVSPVEDELIRVVPALSLRSLLWNLGIHLAKADAPAPERAGRYRLLRWPDAVGLAAPGHPRVAALWTDRTLTVAQMDAMSGLPAATVRWFLEVCLALGLAVDEAEADNPPSAPAQPVEPPSPPPLPPQPRPVAATLGWLGNMRERLKLW